MAKALLHDEAYRERARAALKQASGQADALARVRLLNECLAQVKRGLVSHIVAPRRWTRAAYRRPPCAPARRALTPEAVCPQPRRLRRPAAQTATSPRPAAPWTASSASRAATARWPRCRRRWRSGGGGSRSSRRQSCYRRTGACTVRGGRWRYGARSPRWRQPTSTAACSQQPWQNNGGGTCGLQPRGRSTCLRAGGTRSLCGGSNDAAGRRQQRQLERGGKGRARRSQCSPPLPASASQTRPSPSPPQPQPRPAPVAQLARQCVRRGARQNPSRHQSRRRTSSREEEQGLSRLPVSRRSWPRLQQWQQASRCHAQLAPRAAVLEARLCSRCCSEPAALPGRVPGYKQQQEARRPAPPPQPCSTCPTRQTPPAGPHRQLATAGVLLAPPLPALQLGPAQPVPPHAPPRPARCRWPWRRCSWRWRAQAA